MGRLNGKLAKRLYELSEQLVSANKWFDEVWQRFKLFSRKSAPTPVYDYDPEKEKPIIRASICNGEQVAGFKDRETGEFHEVMLIRNDQDLAEFKQAYGLERVDKEYLEENIKTFQDDRMCHPVLLLWELMKMNNGGGK